MLALRRAPAPPVSTGTLANGFGARVANTDPKSFSPTTVSVMRSCSAPTAASSSGAVENQRTPRSTRTTRSRSQMWKISVALLDQGEMVPCRGTTVSRNSPCRSGRSRSGP